MTHATPGVTLWSIPNADEYRRIGKICERARRQVIEDAAALTDEEIGALHAAGDAGEAEAARVARGEARMAEHAKQALKPTAPDHDSPEPAFMYHDMRREEGLDAYIERHPFGATPLLMMDAVFGQFDAMPSHLRLG